MWGKALGIVASSVREAELALLNAPFGEGGWDRAVIAIAAATRSAGAQLSGVGGPLTIPLNIVHGDFSGPTRHFTDVALYGPCNWRLNTVGAEGAIQHEDHYAAYAAANDTADFDDAVADLDVPYGCQSAFLIEPDRMVGLTLLRRRRDGRCDADTLHAFARLRYQANRAVRAQIALDGEAAAIMLGNLERASCATLLLDRTSAVCAMTAAADRAIGEGPFRLADRAFGVRDPLDDFHLQRAMRRLLESDGITGVRLHQAVVGAGQWSVVMSRLPRHAHGLCFEPELAVTLRRLVTSKTPALDRVRQSGEIRLPI